LRQAERSDTSKQKAQDHQEYSRSRVHSTSIGCAKSQKCEKDQAYDTENYTVDGDAEAMDEFRVVAIGVVDRPAGLRGYYDGKDNTREEGKTEEAANRS